MAQAPTTEEKESTSSRSRFPLPPDDLLYNVPSDIGLVTEELQEMRPLIYRLLIIWFLFSGFLGLYSLIIYCPVLTLRESNTGQNSSHPDTTEHKPPRSETTERKDSAYRRDFTADTLKRSETTKRKDSAYQIGVTTVTPMHPKTTERKDSSTLDTSASRTLVERFLGIPQPPDPIQASLIIVCLAGWLGGVLHGLSSLIDYRSARRLFASWTLWYFVRPFQGALVAVVFLAVVQGGLLPGGSASTVNTIGVIAIGFIVGLSADAATTRLSYVFKTLFAAPDGTDALRGGNTKPEITLVQMREYLANIRAKRINAEKEAMQAPDDDERRKKMAEAAALRTEEQRVETALNTMEDDQSQNDTEKKNNSRETDGNETPDSKGDSNDNSTPDDKRKTDGE